MTGTLIFIAQYSFKQLCVYIYPCTNYCAMYPNNALHSIPQRRGGGIGRWCMTLSKYIILLLLFYNNFYMHQLFLAAVLLPVKCSRDFQAVQTGRVGSTIHTTEDIITHLSCAKVGSQAHTQSHWQSQSGVPHLQKMWYLWLIIVLMWCHVELRRSYTT